jgi:hypothetical protein
MSSPSRVILHLDMDAFFALAEVLAAPSHGKPLIVEASRVAVVATASYGAVPDPPGCPCRGGETVSKAVSFPAIPPGTSISPRLMKLLLNRTPAVEWRA